MLSLFNKIKAPDQKYISINFLKNNKDKQSSSKYLSSICLLQEYSLLYKTNIFQYLDKKCFKWLTGYNKNTDEKNNLRCSCATH